MDCCNRAIACNGAVRAEQQAFAKWGLNYVISEYVPKKLADASAFLP
jgi:DNA topoisomerase VI subunit A